MNDDTDCYSLENSQQAASRTIATLIVERSSPGRCAAISFGCQSALSGLGSAMRTDPRAGLMKRETFDDPGLVTGQCLCGAVSLEIDYPARWLGTIILT